MSSALVWICAPKAASSEFGIDWSVLWIVLAGVTVLMLVIRMVGVMSAKLITAAEAKPVVREALPTKPAPSVENDSAITPELIAVLTAAATAMLRAPVRIDAISVGKMAAQRGWSQEGRREIYLSHRIR
ncbi:MAG TPA: hypothetical protein VKP30_26885 [Polyangiaceae bacterium]|nr:hypothetical protein [Polyangiaceae bacterium]